MSIIGRITAEQRAVARLHEDQERILLLASLLGTSPYQAAPIYNEMCGRARDVALGSYESPEELVDSSWRILRKVYEDRGDITIAQAQVDAWLDLPPAGRRLGPDWHVAAFKAK